MHLSHLQTHLPWSIAYSEGFLDSQYKEDHRFLIHDVQYVMKGLGRIAGVCEKIDHGKPPGMTVEELADNITDLVICALHMASNNPLGQFDLERAVIDKIETRNNIKIPQEVK